MSKSNSDSTNQSIQTLKKQIGIASRAVGEAKKQNRPTETLINQVQDLSQKLKDIQDLTKLETIEEKPNYIPETSLPPQFQSSKNAVEPFVELKVVTNIEMTAWDDYVNQHTNATVYHSGSIRKVVEDSFGHPCHYLSVVNNSNKIQGILPLVEMKSRLFGHFLVSVPFFNYGGLLVSSDHAREKLLQAATELALKLEVSHVEYRHCKPAIDLPARTEKVTMLLSLPDNTEQLWREIGTKVRAQIKKSERFNPITKIGQTELINDFYTVFSRNMRDLGTPVYGKIFFENMIRLHPDAYIVIVYIDNKPVSAAFVIGWRNTIEIPWASTIRSANKYGANMKLYWEVLKMAINNKYDVFDFGRSTREASSFKFKRQWGASLQPLYWHYWLKTNQGLPQINPSNSKFAFFSRMWRHLPLCLSNRIGPSIVKYVP